METLKELNILLGQKNRVFTDNKNLTYKAHNSSRVMRWRLLIEEYGPGLHYLPGKSNIIADCLSMPKIDGNHELFALDKSDIAEYPLNYKLITQYQQKHIRNRTQFGKKLRLLTVKQIINFCYSVEHAN